MAAAIEMVKYKGYVHVDQPSGGLPSLAAVQKGARLLNEKNQKTARAMHPLFARGLDTALSLSINSSGLKVTVAGADGREAVVMNHPIHKIAFVLDVGTLTCFIVKRSGKGKFNCHGFELSSAKIAHAVATRTAELCNELFTKVRRVSHRVKRKSKMDPVPKVPAPFSAEEVKAINAIAEEDSRVVQDAVHEVEAGPADGAAAAAAGGSVGVVDFIDDLSDKLAQLVSGHAGGGEELALDLDSEIFFLGEVTGEMDC